MGRERKSTLKGIRRTVPATPTVGPIEYYQAARGEHRGPVPTGRTRRTAIGSGSPWRMGLIQFLLGAAVGQTQQIIVAHNNHPENAGAALQKDMVIPLLPIGLLVHAGYAGGLERQSDR